MKQRTAVSTVPPSEGDTSAPSPPGTRLPALCALPPLPGAPARPSAPPHAFRPISKCHPPFTSQFQNLQDLDQPSMSRTELRLATIHGDTPINSRYI